MDRMKSITEQLSHLDNLEAIIVYGADDANLLIVMTDLEPPTLRSLSKPVRWWIEQTGAWPRLVSPQLIKRSVDVFPIEMLELSLRRRVVFGRDPFIDIQIDRRALRAQCERELREKLMRLREAYVENHASRALRGVLAASLITFTRIFRACLVLLDEHPPAADRDVVVAFCKKLDVSPEPFHAVARGDDAAFEAYYRVLSTAEARIDRLVIKNKENL